MIERVADRLAERYPEARRAGPRQLTFAVGAAQLHVYVQSPEQKPAFVRSHAVSLHYRIEGALGAAEDLARALLRQLGREVASLVIAPEPVDDRVVDEVAQAWRAAAISGRPAAHAGPTPCLSLELRPMTPLSPIEAPAPLVEPCNQCGVAAYCPASGAPATRPRPLRPLRHAEPFAAALSAARTIAAAWDRPPPRVLEQLLLELMQARQGARSVPAPPFELSIKIERGRLQPGVRVVEYSATGAWRERRGADRGRALTGLAATMLAGAPGAEWLALVEQRQPEGLEVSIGFDAALDDAGVVLPQLYAHVAPGERAHSAALAEAVIGWSAGAASPLGALFDTRLDRPIELVLIAHSPRPGDLKRSKLYLSAPLAHEDAASGLGRADLGPLKEYAPAWGLVVLECGAAGVQWRKHDFPCTAHFQRAIGLPDAFGRGLDEADRARLQRILGGDAFAPWPTWLSVSPSERSLYFIPR